ncbi:uncharacterized protein [Penaeus vannamei]|uniref:uncharacterized protein n=1 Tax=Penaeus vannamei TaxID=6689 RepID=UPI00387F68E3
MIMRIFTKHTSTCEVTYQENIRTELPEGGGALKVYIRRVSCSVKTFVSKMKFCIIATLLAVGLAASSADLQDESGTADGKFIAGYVTRTRFSTLWSTTLKTCYTQLGQNALCQGRRKREAKVLNENLMAADTMRDVLLDSSQDEKAPEVKLRDETEAAKLFNYKQSFTTMTYTSTTENTATTVSVSFHCVPPEGLNYAVC